MAEKKATLLLQLKDMVSKTLGTIGGRLDKLSNNLNKSKFLFAGVAAASGLLAKKFIDAADKMEQWTISFETMLGSAGAAKKLMEEVREFAAKTPFELPSVIRGTKGLLAFGIEADKIIPTLKSLGDVSAGLGVPMERLILNFGQVKAQAKLTGRELRDFAIAGVPLLGTLAENLNKTEAEIGEMVSAGKIGFKEVEDAFLSMSGAGGRFENLMERQMTTVTGVVSNVRDQFFQLSAEMGTYLLPIAKKIGLTLINLFTWIRDLTPQAKFLILAVGGLVAGFAALVAGLGGIIAIAPFIAAAFGVIFSPITLVIGAVAGLAAMFTLIATNALGFRDILTNIFTGLVEVITLLAEAIVAAMTLKFATAKEKTAEAFQKMKELGTESWNELKTNISSAIDGIVAKVKGGNVEILKDDSKKRKELAKREAEERKRKKKEEKEKKEALEATYDYIERLSTSRNKSIALIGKAMAIRKAIISTREAGAKALTATIPPWNFALMAGVLAQGFAQVASIRATSFAEGGIVLPQAGGVPAILGDAGRAEAVIPLESPEAGEMIGGTTIIIQAGTIVADDMSIKEFAEKIDEKLFELHHNKETVSF